MKSDNKGTIFRVEKVGRFDFLKMSHVSNEIDTAEVLSQSMAVLYGPQDAGVDLDQNTEMLINEHLGESEGQSSNLQRPTDLCNNGDMYSLPSQQTQEGVANQSVSANVLKGRISQMDLNTMPTWAASMSEKLSNIQTQLEMQNSRWQMVEHQLKDQNTRMTNIEAQISQIGVLQQKVGEADRKATFMAKEVNDIQTKIRDYDRDIHYYSDICDDIINTNTDLNTRVNEMFERLEKVESKQKVTTEKLVDIQWRSMRENLIFYGIPESEVDQRAPENCELIIKNFIRMEMNIDKDIQFDRVHRLGRYFETQRYPRPIVAKFTFFKDKELVRLTAPKTLIGSCYTVKEQFPPEIEEKRKLLYSEAKRARQNTNNKVRLVRDKLFVNNKEITPQPESNPTSLSRQRERAQSANREFTSGRAQARNGQRSTGSQNRTSMHHDSARFQTPVRRQQPQPKFTKFQQELLGGARSKIQTSNVTASGPGVITSRKYNTPPRVQQSMNRDIYRTEQLTPTQNFQSDGQFNIPVRNRYPPWFNEEQTRQPSLAQKTKPTSPLDIDYSSKRHREYTPESDRSNEMECDIPRANGTMDNGETVSYVNSTRL